MPNRIALPGHQPAHHGITVEQIHSPMGRPFQASCLCGWQSPIVSSRPAAIDAGTAHLAETDPTMHDVLDRMMASPDVKAAINDLPAHAAADVRQAAAATLGRPLVQQSPFWLSEPCPSWCDDAHDPWDHPEDREHVFNAAEVELSLERGADYGPSDPPRWRPQHLFLGLRQHYREISPRIQIFSDDLKLGPFGVSLSLGEASLLADQLADLLKRAAEATR